MFPERNLIFLVAFRCQLKTLNNNRIQSHPARSEQDVMQMKEILLKHGASTSTRICLYCWMERKHLLCPTSQTPPTGHHHKPFPETSKHFRKRQECGWRNKTVVFLILHHSTADTRNPVLHFRFSSGCYCLSHSSVDGGLVHSYSWVSWFLSFPCWTIASNDAAMFVWF